MLLKGSLFWPVVCNNFRAWFFPYALGNDLFLLHAAACKLLVHPASCTTSCAVFVRGSCVIPGDVDKVLLHAGGLT